MQIQELRPIDSVSGMYWMNAANVVGVGAEQLFAAALSLVPPGELGLVLDTLRVLAKVAQCTSVVAQFA